MASGVTTCQLKRGNERATEECRENSSISWEAAFLYQLNKAFRPANSETSRCGSWCAVTVFWFKAGDDGVTNLTKAYVTHYSYKVYMNSGFSLSVKSSHLLSRQPKNRDESEGLTLDFPTWCTQV
jgi:hypothetical protein